MNNTGYRIKEIRKHIGLTQKEFGEKIGLKPTAIGQMENADRNVTERTIILICSEFNVNEKWLRTGEGAMFNESDTFSLDEYIKQNNLTELESEILQGYMQLDKDVRQNLMSSLKALFNKIEPLKDSKADAPSNDPTIEELEEEYKKRRSKSVSETDTPASNGTGGDKNKVV